MKQAIYTLSPGRSGTVFLTALMQQNLAHATVYHERTGFPHFGVNTPDASHATTFNYVGNVDLVRRFWQQKLQRDAADPAHWFVEISHHLSKAGMIENFDMLRSHRHIHLILLRRDPFKVAWSYINRFEFINNGFTWLFTLDPAYPRRIIDSSEYIKQGMFGNAIWYVNEVYARQAYYRQLLKPYSEICTYSLDLADITNKRGAMRFLREMTGQALSEDQIKMPPPQNQTNQVFFNAKIAADVKKLFDKLWQDPDAAGENFFASGRRLGDPAQS